MGRFRIMDFSWTTIISILSLLVQGCCAQVSPSLSGRPNCNATAITAFHNDVQNPSSSTVPTLTPLPGLFIELKNNSQLALRNSGTEKLVIVNDGVLNRATLAILASGTLEEDSNTLKLVFYNSRGDYTTGKASCSLRVCHSGFVGEVKFSNEGHVPIRSKADNFTTDVMVTCLQAGTGIVRVALNCIDSVPLQPQDRSSSFIFIKECPTPPTTVDSSGKLKEVYVIAGVLVFVVLAFVVAVFVARSQSCHFVGNQFNSVQFQSSVLNKGVPSTVTTTEILASTSGQSAANGASQRDGSGYSHVESCSISNVPDRSLCGWNGDHNGGLSHFSVSHGSDGADSNSFSFYEQSSIGHTEWQTSKYVEEITVQPDRLHLGDVMHSGLSVQEMTGTIQHSDGDREAVMIKAFTKAANGGTVERHILEALQMRRVQMEKRRDAFQAVTGIVIPGDHVPPLLIYRYTPNDENLRKWLLRVKSNEISRTSADPSMGWRGNSGESIGCSHLTSLGAQIARGCKYLARYDIVHRDIAARNCIINTRTGTVRICDAIYSPELYPEGYMRHPSFPNLKVPLKWMSVEAFTEALYSTSSDVWAFGVMLWEIFTLGRPPYESISAEELENHLRTGNRLDQPLRCPNSIFTIMGTCWALTPKDRLTFDRISQKMSELSRPPQPQAQHIHPLAASGHRYYDDYGDAA